MAKDGAESDPQVKRVGKLTVPKRLKKTRRQRRIERQGLSDDAWAATGISKASQEGHRQAGPIMKYDDDT